MDQRMFVVKAISVLADNAGVRKIPRQRSGKFLDESRLGLVPAGETRIFQRAQKKQFHEYAVSLLIDVSGSMSGSKLDVACKCTHALEYALTRAGAAVDVFAFNGDYRYVPPATVRDPDLFHKKMAEQLSAYGGINNDADAVRLTAEKLLARREPGKILMVLSDGQPAPGNGPITKMIKNGNRNNADADLINSVSETRAKGITCLAVGILTDCPKQYYGSHHTAVVRDLSELYRSMAKILERNIQRG